MGVCWYRTWSRKEHKWVSLFFSLNIDYKLLHQSQISNLHRCERMNLTMNYNANIIQKENGNYDSLQCYTEATTKPPSRTKVVKFIPTPKPSILHWNEILWSEQISLPDRYLVAYVHDGNSSTLVQTGQALKCALEGNKDLSIYVPTLKSIALAQVAIEEYLSHDYKGSVSSSKTQSHFRMKRFKEMDEFTRSYMFAKLQSKCF